MRRHVTNKLWLSKTLVQLTPIRLQPAQIQFLPVFNFHTSSLQFKRHSDSKARHREEKYVKKQKLEETLEAAEEWVNEHNSNYVEPQRGKRAALLELTDPFEMDALKSKLKEALDRLRKEGGAIKQGKSDPEIIRGLYVELPEQLGGKLPFLDVATCGPKPGDARSLLITVFDTEVCIRFFFGKVN